MRRIAIAAAKGGTGKTTTAVHLAHALALAGREVLLVDCDPRGHASQTFGIAPGSGLAAWLAGEKVLATGVRGGLRLLPSGGPALARQATARDFAARLRSVLTALSGFDVILLDAPPDSGPLQDALLAAASEVLVPVPPDAFALQAAVALRDAIRDTTKEAGDAPRFLGILPTLDEPGTLAAERFESLREAIFPGAVLTTRIRSCESLRLAPLARGTVFDTDPMASGAFDYACLAGEIEPDAA